MGRQALRSGRMILVALCLVLAFPAAAQDSAEKNQNAELEALLERLRMQHADLREVLSERERRFIERVEERETMLSQARERLATAEKRGDRLKARFDELQDQVAEQRQVLDERSADLKDLFAAARQSAGTLDSLLQEHHTGLHAEETRSFLQQLSESGNQPDVEALRRLYLTYIEQMVASGDVRTAELPVTGADGTRAPREVTTLGPFAAVSDGAYLRWEQESQRLYELGAQPPARYRETISGLEPGSREQVAVDPTRGQLLGLYVQVPDLRERIQQGGVIGYIILALGALGILIALVRWVTLFREQRRVQQQLDDLENPRLNNALGRVIGAVHHLDHESAEEAELTLDEAIAREGPRLQRGLGLVKLLASVAPLLGLLGTVVGMIATFQSITLFGTGDPKLMAGGISQALVTTALGLSTAVPLLFLHSLVNARSRAIRAVLEEQTSGLLARRLSHQGS